MNKIALHLGDCLETLKFFEDNCIDSIVTDPPYGLSFMGKKWDYDVPGVDVWAECLRVLKPGGHLLAFAGTRTQHRMAVRIEDAGFEIRDMIAWVYGSGFPKSHNGEWGGTALKPALEPITMARKPIIGTVAENFAEHGTGALNIDGCRVGTDETITATRNIALGSSSSGVYWAADTPGVYQQQPGGRWPANLIHDGSDEVVTGFPESASGSGGRRDTSTTKGFSTVGCGPSEIGAFTPYADAGKGSAARFFYCAKASKADRGANSHPTVKPTDLMAYLVRLVTPPGGIVLDPFMGSGSTGKAAMREGFSFIGCEMSPEYMAIARARIEHELAMVTAANEPAPQSDLFALP